MNRRTKHAALLIAVLLLALPAVAQEPSPRAKELGKKMMCMCGCNQVLTECNHVGCSTSTAMLRTLEQRVGSGDSDDLIFQSFIQEYGQKVMAQPPNTGTGLVAWIMPFLVLVVGFFVVRGVLLRWRRQATVAVAGGPAVSAEYVERARREAEHDAGE